MIVGSIFKDADGYSSSKCTPPGPQQPKTDFVQRVTTRKMNFSKFERFVRTTFIALFAYELAKTHARENYKSYEFWYRSWIELAEELGTVYDCFLVPAACRIALIDKELLHPRPPHTRQVPSVHQSLVTYRLHRIGVWASRVQALSGGRSERDRRVVPWSHRPGVAAGARNGHPPRAAAALML